MPKIIDEAYDMILSIAKKKMFEEGYSALSLRNVAKECGIAVGTIYNYFENKDDLIASIMLEDWKSALDKMDRECRNIDNIQDGFISIYKAIEEFCMIYEMLWDQYALNKGSSKAVSSRHLMLQKQLTERVCQLLIRFGYEKDMDLSVLLAECVLISTLRKEISLHQFEKLIQRLFL